jgi:anion-transporting  ArsA/GET3 family ATPase
MNVVTNALTKVLGAQILKDVQGFVAALDSMFGGFRERADATYQLLKERETAFVVVAAPERDALREAAYFVERLDEEGMPLAGLVLNRVHSSRIAKLGADRSRAAAEFLEEEGGHELTAGLLRLHGERMALIQSEARIRERFTFAHPAVAVAEIPAQPGDIHDLDGLRLIGSALLRG